MDVTYSIFTHVITVEDSGNLDTYGIIATDSKGNMVSSFLDVSLNKSFTEKIVKLLNDCKVKLCHFDDVVIDELNR